MWIILPDLFNSMIGNLLQFFTNSETAATIQEMSSWSFDLAASAFNVGLLLALGGFAVLVWQVVRRQSPAALFVLIWSLFMFLATVAHIRWEYFFAVNIALLSAVFVSWAITFAADEVKKLFGKKQQESAEPKGKKGKKPVSSASQKPDVLKIGILAVVVVLAVVFTGISSVTAVQSASVYGQVGTTEKDWIEATEWLVEGTPETGIDYYKLYEREGFSYPNEAYGVMSWWDYGHYITTIGERIPNSNPFQAGVSGSYGAAQVLTATDENTVVQKLDHLGTKYVMTDYQMAGSKFGAMAIWANTELQTSPFYTHLLQQTSADGYSVVTAQSKNYYNTLTVRLQNFDGSYTEAGSVYLVLTDTSAGYDYPVITYTKSYANADEAWKAANEYNAQSANTASGKYAYVISIPRQNDISSYFAPNADIPALKHFRLVHESSTYVVPVDSYTIGVTDANGGGTAWVKTFEYVKGAIIKGNGIISIDVTTNNGRTFTYRQVSENGQFVVPYATGQTGEIKTGVYKIEGSGQTFTVSENAVQNGLTVN
ncbi:oligosaccharyl transferase, archaeosortase A system-associated, partial [Methanocorpusculum sp.]|nr:oligosaccharyl transferase, archaeosortase A system-associated [Methanocorpusculum sp.]